MPDVRCFLIEPTGFERVSHRRVVIDSKCPGRFGYHNALETICEVPAGQFRDIEVHGPDEEAKHPGPWPERCPCGFVFSDPAKIVSRIHVEALWRPISGFGSFVLRDAPEGAMWRATWIEPEEAASEPDPVKRASLVDARKEWVGPDGRCYVVKLPGGFEWVIDGPAGNSGHWTRTGEPPAFVVKPSIKSPNYHGFLGGPAGDRPGVLVSC